MRYSVPRAKPQWGVAQLWFKYGEKNPHHSVGQLLRRKKNVLSQFLPIEDVLQINK